MAIIEQGKEKKHRVRAKLYPGCLEGLEGKFVARTDDEASLPNEKVCASAKERGGYTGSEEDMLEHVRQYFQEAFYQVADGYSVNTGYFTIHPSIGGVWESALEPFDPVKHPIRFTVRMLKPARDIAKTIEVFIDGVSEDSGYIAEVMDVDTEAVNETLTSGGLFAIKGHKIKIAGNEDCGLFFVESGGTSQRVKATGHLVDNTTVRLAGRTPALAAGKWKVEVVTQYGGGTVLLKTPRTVTFAAELTVD